MVGTMIVAIFLLLLGCLGLLCTFSRSSVLQTQPSNECRTLPGPKGLPWFGVAHRLPRLGSWFTLKKWADEYGPIFRIQLAGQTHVVISQESVARQLLVSRSSIYSSRPSIPTVIDSQSVNGMAEYLPLMAKNENHTRHRKAGHRNLTGAAHYGFYQFPSIEAKRCIVRLGEESSNWQAETEDMTSRIASRLAWGSPDAAEALRKDSWNLLVHISPAGFISNLLNPLSILPIWLSPWKWVERNRHKRQADFFLKQLEKVQHSIATGQAGPSYMRNYLENRKSGILKDDIEAAFAIGMVAVTAIFTISSPIQTFVRAAALHPQWLRKVQEELDLVVGEHRMPEVSDASNSPWLRAFIKECLRWRPPIPTGIPHELEQDDVFEGSLIPKGSRIHPLEYAFCRDSTIYPEPERFNPERWMSPTYPTTYQEPLSQYPTIIGFSSFGWGKRYCIGQQLTWHELLCFCGGIAWAFDITPKLKADEGRPQIPESDGGDARLFKMEMPENWDESLIIARPRGPEINLAMRSERRREVLLRSYEESKEADVLKGMFEIL